MPGFDDAGLLVFLVLAAVGIAWAVIFVPRYLATGDPVQADRTARKVTGTLAGIATTLLGVGVLVAIVVGLIALAVGTS